MTTKRLDLERIQAELDARFWTRKQLAEACGLSENVLNVAWYRGGNTSPATAAKIALLFDWTAAQVYAGEEG